MQREGYDYVLSGSLLDVELRGVRSLPVGYVRIVDMYPLDFEEFCWAIVLCGSNVIEDGKVAYLPIYMIMFV